MSSDHNHKVIIDFTALIIITSAVLFLNGLAFAIGKMTGMASQSLFLSSPSLYDGLINGFLSTISAFKLNWWYSMMALIPAFFAIGGFSFPKTQLPLFIPICSLIISVLLFFSVCVTTGREIGNTTIEEVVAYYSNNAETPIYSKPAIVTFQDASGNSASAEGLLTTTINGIHILFQKNRTLAIYPKSIVSVELHHR